ncbi:gem-associated protein 6-like [Mya arenaria]|uniref:gem-associated protein 6-like n=1 Tax=Mya arenaria TaxID=6604 RepID=UPI0022E7308C|nr:gem-associated protein 6-like [Mya arenaria]XP_052815938.1 gem-associated protein 6-like [Mya arenaria]
MNEAEDLHPIFTKDPEEWMQFVYKKVSLVTDDGVEHVGLVYTVDPVSETFVLVNFDGEDVKVNIVVGHCVKAVSVLIEDSEMYKQRLDRLFRPIAASKMTEEEIRNQQTVVRMWLLKNRLPVEVSGPQGENLSVAEALVIQPPYGPDNCVSNNEIILGKIQGLIKNMPSDQHEW